MNFDREPVIIRHTRPRAVVTFVLVVVVWSALAIICFPLGGLSALVGSDWGSAEIAVAAVAASLLALVMALSISTSVQGLRDAGNVALVLDQQGVKFDRYLMVRWQDIVDVSLREDMDGPDTLWISVTEGVDFLPPTPSWLARIALDREIDVSGYGHLSIPDDKLLRLLQAGVERYGSPA